MTDSLKLIITQRTAVHMERSRLAHLPLGRQYFSTFAPTAYPAWEHLGTSDCHRSPGEDQPVRVTARLTVVQLDPTPNTGPTTAQCHVMPSLPFAWLPPG